jgi:penicillin V acylase-like amidase (Ntn superfamily)
MGLLLIGVAGTLSWTNGSCISFASSFKAEERYLRLSYYLESSYRGKNKS